MKKKNIRSEKLIRNLCSLLKVYLRMKQLLIEDQTRMKTINLLSKNGNLGSLWCQSPMNRNHFIKKMKTLIVTSKALLLYPQLFLQQIPLQVINLVESSNLATHNTSKLCNQLITLINLVTTSNSLHSNTKTPWTLIFNNYNRISVKVKFEKWILKWRSLFNIRLPYIHS